ncbi:hypothetical protein [Burkholderia pseudomultivorans]|uniref:hypothetical protein n=1 Tax=Burkholderia pseudomultivorans TaxID=1207504 RepID=UPI0012D93046|nr:hypothetical protein [Burkholderia pseudomultivorans]
MKKAWKGLYLTPAIAGHLSKKFPQYFDIADHVLRYGILTGKAGIGRQLAAL